MSEDHAPTSGVDVNPVGLVISPHLPSGTVSRSRASCVAVALLKCMLPFEGA